ncbi:MAG: hypothetical protein ACTHU0_06045 [Kofleriaceae bacterium]
MRIAIALTFLLAACSGPKAKTESPLVNEGSAAPSDECCCKSTPMTSEDGQPVYEASNRMECSGKQGTCVDDVQCTAAAHE